MTAKDRDEATSTPGSCPSLERALPVALTAAPLFIDDSQLPSSQTEPECAKEGQCLPVDEPTPERTETHEAFQLQSQRLEILHDIGQAVLLARSPRDVAYAAVHGIARMAPCRMASVMLLDLNVEEVTALAFLVDGETTLDEGLTLPLNPSEIPAELWQGDPRVVQQVDERPLPFLLGGVFFADGPRSYVSVPLIVEGELIGCLNLAADTTNYMSQRRIDAAVQIADLVAIALQNTRLHEAGQAARRLAENLANATLALTSSLDVNATLETLLDSLGTVVPYDSACILWPEDDGTLSARHLRGYDKYVDPKIVCGLRLDPATTPSIRTVLSGRRSHLVPNTRQHRGWQLLTGSQHIGSWMGVPLICGEQVVAVCSLDKAHAGFFSPDHLHLAESICAQASIAVHNALLHEQVETSRRQLQVLTHRQVEILENERRTIARELHDDAGQALTSLLLGLGMLEREAGPGTSWAGVIADMRDLVDRVLVDLHQLAKRLRPPALDHLGLVPALQQYIEAFSRQYRLPVDFETVGLDGTRLNADVEITLYRVIQEALTNVVRHAGATNVGVLLERRGERIVAVIEDNGAGFDPEEALSKGRLGLLGIRERAEMLGGRLSIESTSGIGTSLFVEVQNAHPNPDC